MSVMDCSYWIIVHLNLNEAIKKFNRIKMLCDIGL